MDFELPQLNRSSRAKDVYAGGWQLASQFLKLDSILGDEYERNIVIGHGLIYALHDFSKSKHVKTQQADEVRSYYDVLHTINSNLHSNNITLDNAVWDLKNAVVHYLNSDNLNTHPSSLILTFLFNNTKLLGSVNPSEFLQKGANNLYSIVRKKGTLTGNRVIEGENYKAILDAFRNV